MFHKDFPEDLPHCHFFPWGLTLSLLTVMFPTSKMCSTMFRICCISFWLLMTNINTFSYVLVYGTYLFYVILVYFHNIFHLNGGHILCRRLALIRQIKEFIIAVIHTNITITWFQFFTEVLRVFSLPLYHTHPKFLYIY